MLIGDIYGWESRLHEALRQRTLHYRLLDDRTALLTVRSVDVPAGSDGRSPVGGGLPPGVLPIWPDPSEPAPPKDVATARAATAMGIEACLHAIEERFRSEEAERVLHFKTERQQRDRNFQAAASERLRSFRDERERRDREFEIAANERRLRFEEAQTATAAALWAHLNPCESTGPEKP